MAEKTDGDGKVQLSISSEIAWILREWWFHRHKKSKPKKLANWKRFLFSFLGSMYPVGYSLYDDYLHVEDAIRVYDISFLITFIFGLVIRAIPAVLVALVISTVDQGHSPFRLYMGGFFALFLPWVLITRVIS